MSNTNVWRYLFLLSLFLIGVVYFVGLATDGTVFFSGLNNLLLTVTGRNAQGQFANYPG